MRVVVLGIRKLSKGEEFEVHLRVGSREHRGTLRRDPAAPVWNPDSELSSCLQDAGRAPKHLAKLVGEFSHGKQLSFPVDLDDF